MRARDLLKWKRALNEIKFKHSELELIKEICRTHGVEFHMFMEEYCEQNGINLGKLNQEKSAKEAKAKQEFQAIEEEQQRPSKGKMVVSQNHFTENEPAVEELFVEERDHDEMRRAFKDLFKKLALNLHPDRAAGLTAEEREVRLSMFKDAKQALDNGDYFLLLEMSEKFNIRMPKNYKQQTRWMKARIKQLNQEIQAEKHTYNYVFSECETIDEKVKIVRNFLRQIFQI